MKKSIIKTGILAADKKTYTIRHYGVSTVIMKCRDVQAH